MSSPHSDPMPAPAPPSSDAKPTPAQPRAQEGVLNTGKKKTSSINRDKTRPTMKADNQGQESLDGDNPSFAGRETYQKLLDQILTTIAQDDVIANSGLELYHRVNECARDYMEAKQIAERREHEIAAISTKIEAMQATMDNATKHLHKAQAIAAEAIDSSIAEQFRLREQDNLTNILIGMTNAIAKDTCHSWPREKVNKHLEVCFLPLVQATSTQVIQHNPPSTDPRNGEAHGITALTYRPQNRIGAPADQLYVLPQDLQSVYHKNKHYCQSSMVSSGIVHVAKHFVFHADYDDAFEPMLFHLANQTDYKGFVERCREEDHESARQHQVDYTTRPSFPPKSSTAAAPLGDQGLTDKVKGNQAGGSAPDGGLDGAAGAAQAQSHGSKQAPLQNSTTLPPRSSSLPSSARKTPANVHGRIGHRRLDVLGDVVFHDPHTDTTHVYKHFDFKPNADMNELAGKICFQLESPTGLTSDKMNVAVLESIAGLEAIFKDGTGEAHSNLRKDAASVSLS